MPNNDTDTSDDALSDISEDTAIDSPSKDDSNQKTIRELLEEDSGKSVFVNRNLVEPDTIIDEERIVGRDDQLQAVIAYLKPALRDERPPNMLLYGPSGTGKSLIVNAVCGQIVELCESQDINFGVISLNCQPITTLDRAVYKLVETVAKDVGVDIGVPATGVSTEQKYERLYDLINTYYDSVIFILDEIDLLIGREDEPAYSKLLYQLSRAGKTDTIHGTVSVAALTNDPKFMENVDGRSESSFNPEDIPFSDYDANQLREILEHRRDAFRNGTLSDDVIPLVAAFAAQSHGDARKGIDLFRKAGDLANRQNDDVVTESHVRDSQDEVDKDRMLTQIEGLSTQKKISLYATAAVAVHTAHATTSVPSPVGYQVYKWITELLDADQMTRETYIKYVKELNTYGIVNAERKSRGRGQGMHMEFSFSDNPRPILDLLAEDSRLTAIAGETEHLKTIAQTRMQKFESS
ncbi:orc1/cdc6 family replication initiation protein [Haladaptatus cibarius]|uniref:orc1/cdc6 family replication initiation protein n=1 Tax=Haladaptatus cibarius TaxID=453847 RepID=UPI000678A227|nr:orc1/cdc6 family replication initiation protein [Haladaptatus cibarius]